MDYTVLARRFRPQAFGEVVGQENVAQALRNAISSERVAHAYLFTGARGVGKTSMARILAKSLNCPKAINGDPCNQCDVCESVSAGSDMDVIEIDGASNRGIEDIRSLRANVNVKSMRSRYKIYIIDEVHMLTREAFNALLKTLEEPPPNVKFVFCTTEPQKVPDTILSRCQRFDFGTIATHSIRKRLTEISTAEGVVVQPEAVDLVARRANGSMRDSQSLFDQLLAFGGKEIAIADVHRLLGTAPDERLIELADSLINGDRRTLLAVFQSALDSGVQLSELADQLLSYFRDLMVLSAGAQGADLMSVSSDCRETLATQAHRWGLATILAALQILADTKGRMRGATYGRVLAEMALIRISMLEHLDEIGSLIQHLKGAGGASPAGSRPAGAPASTRPLPRPDTSAQKKTELTGAVSPRPPTPENREASTTTTKSLPGADSELAADSALDEAASTSSSAAAPKESVSEDSGMGIPFEAGRENEIWTQMLARLPLMSQSPARSVSSAAISGPNQLVLTFPTRYYRDSFERLCPLAKLEEAARLVTGRALRVMLIVDEKPVSEMVSDSSTTQNAEPERPSADLEKDPFVLQVKSIFNVGIR